MEHDDWLPDSGAIEHSGDAFLALDSQLKEPSTRGASVTVASACTPAPWSLCILNQAGEILLHRNMKAAPAAFLKVIAPSQAALVVCVESGTWLADLGAREGLPFVLGHALSLQAIHGGKTTHETIDVHKIAGLLRGGMRPQAYVSPAAMRAPRALLRLLYRR